MKESSRPNVAAAVECVGARWRLKKKGRGKWKKERGKLDGSSYSFVFSQRSLNRERERQLWGWGARQNEIPLFFSNIFDPSEARVGSFF